MTTQKKTVVIIGGGFGGINAAKILGREKRVKVCLIDKKNYHLFQPLLYQVATAGLNPAEIAVPIRSILSPFENCETFLQSVSQIDFVNKLVLTESKKQFSFDYLIMATGVQHSYFGNNSWEVYAPGLKTLEHALEIRRRVFLAFEQAENESDPEKIKSLLTFVVVGAGPTGVELAGALGEISRFALKKEFRHIDPNSTKIILLEAGPRILPSFSESISQSAQKDLEALGVAIWINTAVTKVCGGRVELGAKNIECQTVLWAAGVEPAQMSKGISFKKDQKGRLITQNDLSLETLPHVFAIGDMAHVKDKFNQPLPGVAAVAIQQGRHAAKNIIADLDQEARKNFNYCDKGQMATIGRTRAVAEIGKLKTSGIFAWLAWIVVHIYYLIGFRNRFFVMIQWAISFFTFKKGARIIQESDYKSHAKNNSD